MGIGMLAGMVDALGGASEGFMAGQDRQRRQAREDEEAAARKDDRAYTNEQRQLQREQQARDKRLRESIEAATKEFTVEEVTPPQASAPVGSDQPGALALAPPMTPRFRVGGQEYSSREQADAAAAAANKPEVRLGRAATAMETNGDVLGGLQMRNALKQSRVGDLQLKAGERAEAVAAFDGDLKNALRSGGPEGLAEMLTKSKADTDGGKAQFKVTYSADGTKWRLDMVGPNGELVPRTQEFTKDPRGYAEAFVLFSQGVPETQKLQHYVAQQNADTQARYREDQAKNMEEQRRLEERKLNMLAAGGGQAGAAPLWDDKADTFLRQRYTVADPVTGANKVDGDGLLFAKQIAMAAARDKFGGDTTSALGYAFDLDQKIAQDAGGDPAKVREGRQRLLAMLQAGTPVTRPPTKAEIIMQDMAATGTKDAIVDINGKRAAYGNAKMSDAVSAPKGKGSQPRATEKPREDLSKQAEREKVEMANGQRLQFSPEVKAMLDEQAQKELAAQQAETKKFQAQEFERAQKARRGY